MLHTALPFTTDSMQDRELTVAFECSLDEAKASVRRKLSVPCHQKIDSYGLVETCGNSPHKIPQDKIVFILPCAVITVEVDRGLPKSIPLKKEVEEGHNSVSSFRDEMGLVDQEVHLSRKTFTADPNYVNI